MVGGTPDFDTLSDDLAPWMTLGGVAMVLAGLAWGEALLRARAVPRWSAATLMAGVVAVALASGGPEGLQVAAAAVRDAGLAAVVAASVLRRGAAARV